MRVGKAFFNDFRNVQVAELGLHVLKQENVRAFHVAVQDSSNVEGAQAAHNLDKDVPNLLLLDVSLFFLISADFLKHIPVVSILHHKAKTTAGLVDEGCFKSDHGWVVDAGQNANLVEGILFFFFCEIQHFDLL